MASANPTPPRIRKERLPLGLRLLFVLLLAIVIAAGSMLGTLLGYQYNLPKIQSLEDYRPDVITDVYSDDNRVIGEFAIERRIVVSHDEIPTYLQLALIAVEDDQFYNHSGINYYANIRALYKDIIRMSKSEGASTITQQLARMLLGSYEKTFDRKIKELLTAWKIERQYSKQQILTLYANLHNMGPGIYGVAAAADYYFGKPLKDLTLEECATIAGLPRNPGRYSPRLHPEAALARRNYVLDRMAAEHIISGKLAAETKKKPLILKAPQNEDSEIAPHFIEWVRESLAARYSTDEIWRRGMRVYTTLNVEMQRAALDALREGLRRYDKKHGWRGPVGNVLRDGAGRLDTYSHPDWRRILRPGDIAVGLVEEVGKTRALVRIGRYRGSIGAKEIAWTKAQSPAQILKAGDLAHFRIASLDEEHHSASLALDQHPLVQGALIILENRTGEIKAMVGGYDFEASQFNRATQAMRQVGSTFKPLVYATALERGMTPESILLDSPVSFTDALGRAWRPSNYDGKFKGAIPLRLALAESRNVPTVRLASQIGIHNVVVTARRFGIEGPLDPYLPLALGACEATPLEMASAFTVFPNLGSQAKPYFIRRVEDYNRVPKEENTPQIREVLKPEIAAQMLELLQDVVRYGTAKSAGVLRWPLGGKTGTTNDFTDAWFIGFTPSITAAVWVGFDEKKTLGERESGAVAALPIWIDCMREILKDKPAERFPVTEAAGQTIPESLETQQQESKPLFIEELPVDNPESKLHAATDRR